MKDKTLEDYFPILKNNLFFRLENDDLKSVLENTDYEIRDLQRGTYIFHEGDYIRKAGIVLEGELVVCKSYLDGQESVLDMLRSSKIFGLDIALTKTGISAFSVVASRMSKVILFSFNWDSFFSQLPPSTIKAMTENIIKYISGENIRKQRKIEIVSQNGLRKRIRTYLEFMRSKNGDQFSIPFSREQFACFLCVNRSALSHELGLMRQEGLIDFKKNQFTILKK
jgi:CRP-like cAMP-binding protein